MNYDITPSDLDDILPVDSAINVTVGSDLLTSKLKLTGGTFDPELDVQTPKPAERIVFPGIIMEQITSSVPTSVEDSVTEVDVAVSLQDGRSVKAKVLNLKYGERIKPNDSCIVIRGKDQEEWYCFTQRYETKEIRLYELTSDLIKDGSPGDPDTRKWHCTGKRLYYDSDAQIYESDEDADDETLTFPYLWHPDIGPGIEGARVYVWCQGEQRWIITHPEGLWRFELKDDLETYGTADAYVIGPDGAATSEVIEVVDRLGNFPGIGRTESADGTKGYCKWLSDSSTFEIISVDSTQDGKPWVRRDANRKLIHLHPQQTELEEEGDPTLEHFITLVCGIYIDDCGHVLGCYNYCGVWISPWGKPQPGPKVTINQAGYMGPTNASPINFTVVFDREVEHFDETKVTLSGTAGATTAVVTGDGPTYNVAVSGMTQDGTVIATIEAGKVHDTTMHQNPNYASTSTGSGNVVEYDTTHPTCTIAKTDGQPATVTEDNIIHFTVTFSEDVFGFDSTCIGITNTGDGDAYAIVNGGPQEFDVKIRGMEGRGIITVSVAADVCQDEATHGNLVADPNDATCEYDYISPTVTIAVKAGQDNPTNEGPVEFTVVFSEVVEDFATGDVDLSGSTGVTGELVETVTGSGTTYNVAVSGMSGAGNIIAHIDADVAHSGANGNVASPTGATVEYDDVKPTCVVSATDTAASSPVEFDVVFSKSVTGFDAVHLGGTAGATTYEIEGSGTTYTVAVSGMTTDGTVTLHVEADIAEDELGNTNAVSNTKSVSYISPLYIATTGCTPNVVGTYDMILANYRDKPLYRGGASNYYIVYYGDSWYISADYASPDGPRFRRVSTVVRGTYAPELGAVGHPVVT
jgi:hypothetical protein